MPQPAAPVVRADPPPRAADSLPDATAPTAAAANTAGTAAPAVAAAVAAPTPPAKAAWPTPPTPCAKAAAGLTPINSTRVVIYGASSELTIIQVPINSTVTAGATIDEPGMTSGIKLAVAAVSIRALVTTAASTQPKGQQTRAMRPRIYFVATPAIGRIIKKARKIGLSAQPAVSRI